MLEPLYLDTARLGRMSPKASRASIEFARFASEHGCTLYLSELLEGGFDAWPSALQRQFPDLADWQGVAGLGNRLKAVANARTDSEVAVAARSATLMRFAARLMTGPCRQVLLTDLTWPAYEKCLERERRTASCNVTKLNLRQDILLNRLTENEVIDRVVEAYIKSNCDGLFLPLIDNLGVKLPIPVIVARIRRLAPLRFAVVDAAQAIGQVPLELAADYCDLAIAGCHKWLRAHSPMGVALFGHPQTRDYIQHSLIRWMRSGLIDDPLLAFSHELLYGDAQPFGETVAVAPFITSNAAADDSLRRPDSEKHPGNCRQQLIDLAGLHNWKCISPDDAMQSKILLFKAKGRTTSAVCPEHVRNAFRSQGIALSTYPGPLLRMSLPEVALSEPQLTTLNTAFAGLKIP